MVKQMRFLVLLLGAMALSSLAFAQKTVTGTVTDANNGDPLPGANIKVKSAPSKGTITDFEGNYSITVEEGQTLVFSFVGYNEKEVQIGEQDVVNVVLSPSEQSLDEVVVIGYGQVRREDATGSVSKVSTDEIDLGSTSPQELLSGKSAGVQITSSGGAPGSGATIRIRGGSSMSASNDPLIVIDGVPIDNEGVAGMRNPLNTIHPSDIESFTVLKDASATAIYGSRASNGVIIIETKKGREGSDMEISYNGSFSIDTRTDEIDVLSGDEYREFIQENYAGNEGALNALGDANTDWQEQIFRNSMSQDHNVSLSGSVNSLPYRASVGYSNSEGLLKSSNLERTTASIALNPSFLDDHLKLDINLKGMYIENTFADWGAIGSAVGFDPTKPVMADSTYYYDNFDMSPGNNFSSNQPYGGYYTWVEGTGQPVAIATSNPVAMLELRDNKAYVKRSVGNIKADYKFHFLPALKATVKAGYDYSISDGHDNTPAYAAWEVPNKGRMSKYTQDKKNELLDFYLTYNKDIEAISSNINAMAGYSWQHFWRDDFNQALNVPATEINRNDFESEQAYLEEYNAIGADTLSAPDHFKTENYLVSFFGRFNYTLKERYLLTFTIRRDGTSRFSEDTRWGLFPSAAFAWKIHSEPFLENAESLNELKLRLGYGVTGQQNIGSGNYPYLARYTFSTPTARYQFGDQFVRTLRPEGYDANIKWEETTTYNIGLDYGLFDNRINGSLELYYKETDDLINTIPVPAGTNLTNRLLTNVGDMKNRGVEFNINTYPISKTDFSWQVGFNVTYNENEITRLTSTDDPTYQGVETGGISGGVGNTVQIHSVGYPRSSFFVYEQVYDESGNPLEGVYVDRNGDGTITAQDKYRYQDPTPDTYMGFNSSLKYKNFDFRFSGRVNIGNYVYNNIASNNNIVGQAYTNPGFLTNMTTSVYDAAFQNAQYFSDYYVRNGSFLRLDNVTLGYTFNKLTNQNINLRLYGTVRNALLVTNYEGLDPEMESGIDNNLYPRPRTYVFGLSMNF